MAERALGTGQGLAAPPMLPGKRFAAYRKAVATPSHSAALLCLSFWDTPPSSAWPLFPSLCVQLGASVSAASHTTVPNPLLWVSSLPAQPIPSANVIKHHIKFPLNTQHVLCIRVLSTFGVGRFSNGAGWAVLGIAGCSAASLVLDH